MSVEFQWNTGQLGYLITTLSEKLGILRTLAIWRGHWQPSFAFSFSLILYKMFRKHKIWDPTSLLGEGEERTTILPKHVAIAPVTKNTP